MIKHKLPELFEIIIETDEAIKEFYTNTVISIEDHKQVQEYRNGLRVAAQNFVKRQRGNNNHA